SCRGGVLWNDDLHLRSWKLRQSFGERNVVVPRWDDRDASRAAPHGELALPASDVVSRAGEPLAATAVTETAHPPDHRLFERRRVVPARARQMPRRALQRAAKAEPGVADRDHHDAAAEALRPALALHRHPTALAGMLDDVLADFGQR